MTGCHECSAQAKDFVSEQPEQCGGEESLCFLLVRTDERIADLYKKL
jgi:hypothetical protein